MRTGTNPAGMNSWYLIRRAADFGWGFKSLAKAPISEPSCAPAAIVGG